MKWKYWKLNVKCVTVRIIAKYTIEMQIKVKLCEFNMDKRNNGRFLGRESYVS